MIIFFENALQDWILISSIYNAINQEMKKNPNFDNVAIIRENEIISITGRTLTVQEEENIVIIAHGDENGNLTNDMNLFFGLIKSILPTNYNATIQLRSCWAGRNSPIMREEGHLNSLVYRVYHLLSHEFPNIKVKGVCGPNIDFIDDNGIWHELCVNPQKTLEALNIQNSLIASSFNDIRIQNPQNMQQLIDQSSVVAKKTRPFFISFTEKLKKNNCVLTANIYNYWSKEIEGKEKAY